MSSFVLSLLIKLKPSSKAEKLINIILLGKNMDSSGQKECQWRFYYQKFMVDVKTALPGEREAARRGRRMEGQTVHDKKDGRKINKMSWLSQEGLG